MLKFFFRVSNTNKKSQAIYAQKNSVMSNDYLSAKIAPLEHIFFFKLNH